MNINKLKNRLEKKASPTLPAPGQELASTVDPDFIKNIFNKGKSSIKNNPKKSLAGLLAALSAAGVAANTLKKEPDTKELSIKEKIKTYLSDPKAAQALKYTGAATVGGALLGNNKRNALLGALLGLGGMAAYENKDKIKNYINDLLKKDAPNTASNIENKARSFRDIVLSNRI